MSEIEDVTDVEDALRATMRAHDALAPTAAEFCFRPPPGRARGSHALATVAAAACVVVVAGAGLLVSNRSDQHAPTTPVAQGPTLAERPAPTVAPIRSCPSAMPSHGAAAYWIPQPAKGINVATRFVPLQTPSQALVCAYVHGGAGKLTGSRTLGGNLSAISDDLAWRPPSSPETQPCADYLAVTDGDYYLVALSYPSATMWIAVPGNHCDGSSNGRFTTDDNLQSQAATAYRTGHWSLPSPPPARPNECASQSEGRLGQQSRLVPDEPVSATVCRPGRPSRPGHPGEPARTVTVSHTDLDRLVGELNRLATAPFTYGWQCGPSDTPAATYELTFTYHVGPPVQVEIDDGCRPEVDNGNLQASSAGAVLPLVQQLLGAH